MRAVRIATVLALIVSAIAASPASNQMQQRAVLDTTVNGVDFGDVSLLLNADDVLLRGDQLAKLGLSRLIPAGADTATLVSLKSLAPKLAFSLDMNAVRLAVTSDPHYLPGTRMQLGLPAPAPQVPQAAGGFVNYSLQRFGDRLYASLEGNASVGGGTLFTSLVGGVNGNAMTSWTVDNPTRMRRAVAGDELESFDDLLGSGVVRGVTIERDFLLNPGYQRIVTGDLSGYATTPTTADVYVNGVLVSRQALPPGPFDISGIRAEAGAANAQVVLHDAYGNEQTISSAFYQSTQTLPKGMTDYLWSAGRTLGQNSNHTGIFGRYDLGLSNSLTAGARVAIASNLSDAGMRIAGRTRLGEFAVTGIESSALGRAGFAGEAAYTYQNARYAFTGSLLRQSNWFANLDFGPQDDKALETATADFSAALSERQSAGVSYQRTADRDAGAFSAWFLHDDLRLNGNTALSLGYRMSRDSGGRSRSFLATIIFPSGRNESSSATLQSGGLSAMMTRGATPAQPLGYTLSLSRSASSTLAAYGATYAAPFGRYEFESGGAGLGSAAISASGGIAFIGGHAYFTQPIQESFALVDTSGLAGVAIGSNGAAPIVTDKHGRALLPNLPAYYANTITVDPSKTPQNYTFTSVQQTVVPGFRAGTIVHFNVRRIQSFVGRLAVESRNAEIVPAFGLLTLTLSDGSNVTSDIGEDGAIYLQNIASGGYPALIQYRGGTCTFTMQIPQSADPFVRLGTIRCVQSSLPHS